METARKLKFNHSSEWFDFIKAFEKRDAQFYNKLSDEDKKSIGEIIKLQNLMLDILFIERKPNKKQLTQKLHKFNQAYLKLEDTITWMMLKLT